MYAHFPLPALANIDSKNMDKSVYNFDLFFAFHFQTLKIQRNIYVQVNTKKLPCVKWDLVFYVDDVVIY